VRGVYSDETAGHIERLVGAGWRRVKIARAGVALARPDHEGELVSSRTERDCSSVNCAVHADSLTTRGTALTVWKSRRILLPWLVGGTRRTRSTHAWRCRPICTGFTHRRTTPQSMSHESDGARHGNGSFGLSSGALNR
jgi:hypothetical protein